MSCFHARCTQNAAELNLLAVDSRAKQRERVRSSWKTSGHVVDGIATGLAGGRGVFRG